MNKLSKWLKLKWDNSRRQVREARLGYLNRKVLKQAVVRDQADLNRLLESLRKRLPVNLALLPSISNEWRDDNRKLVSLGLAYHEMLDSIAWVDFQARLEMMLVRMEKAILDGKRPESDLHTLRETAYLLRNILTVPEEVLILKDRAEEFLGLHGGDGGV